MSFVINAFFAIILLIYGFKYAFGNGLEVAHPFNKKEKYRCNNDLSFMIFSVMTAMVFLGPLSLVKYGIWIFIMLVMSRRWVKKWDGVMTMYFIFIVWNLYTLSYSNYVGQGRMMIVKFCLPILYFWMGYNAIKQEMDLWTFMRRIVVYCLIYAFLIGGFACKFYSPLYVFMNWGTGELFISYASLADFFAILSGVPIILYLFTKEIKYLYIFAAMLVSTILFAVRTGLGATTLCFCIMFLVYKKGKAIPAIGLVITLFIGAIFFIPSVREKMFGDDSGNVTVDNMQNAEIQMSGREYMWERIMEHCYYPNTTFGSGCGGALGWLKDINKDGGLQLIHSDWVQMMSESGNIGLGLYILFAIAIMIKTLRISLSYKNSKLLTVFGGVTAGSFAAMFFCMGFDNVITYSQQAYVLPFMLFGIFLKLIDMKRSGQISS